MRDYHNLTQSTNYKVRKAAIGMNDVELNGNKAAVKPFQACIASFNNIYYIVPQNLFNVLIIIVN